jgi:NAD(P)-dependent dehydrogenase (short-subunit alcohol dehydrogenase family)
MSFKSKTVVITGASGGIGGETARSEAFAFRADVSNPKEVRAMMEAVRERFGRIDVLVNCAAKHPPPMFDFENPDWDLWRRMAHVNIMGIIACSQYAAPYLKETGGNIVNVVMDWDAGGIGYSLTKTAGTPLTRGLARQLAPIRVNAISPGAVDTWGMTDEEKEYWVERTLLKRVGQPRDIAGAIVFLASEAASYITGATLQVDGGTRLLV